MLKRVVLFGAFICFVLAEDNSPREVSYPSMDPCPQGGCLSPVFDKGYFFQMKDYRGAPSDGYALWDPDGKPVYQVNIAAPDGTPGHLRQDAAIDTDGTAIVGITYGGFGGNGRVKGGGIVVVDAAGKQTQFIDTQRWLPAHVCFAEDHSIWAAGRQLAPNDDHVTSGDYQMVRKYSREGKLIGEFLPRSLFPAGLTPLEDGKLFAASDRIGVLTHPGMNAREPEWIELDSDGKMIGRWKLGTQNHAHQLGFTADARLFRQSSAGVSNKRQVMIFDRPASSWQPSDAAGSPSANTYLIGAVRNNLVFENRMDGVRITWVPVTQSR